jgi:hypothetical protein
LFCALGGLLEFEPLGSGQPWINPLGCHFGAWFLGIRPSPAATGCKRRRPQGNLKTIPVVAAGVADHIWTVREMIEKTSTH